MLPFCVQMEMDSTAGNAGGVIVASTIRLAASFVARKEFELSTYFAGIDVEITWLKEEQWEAMRKQRRATAYQIISQRVQRPLAGGLPGTR